MISDASWRWVELVGSVVAPTVVLTFGGGFASPAVVLVAGLLPPLAVALGSAIRAGKPSVLSAVAVASVCVTGGIGLLRLDGRWFALKELLVPAAIGALLVASASTRFAALGAVFEQLFDRERLGAALAANGGRGAYDDAVRAATARMGWITAASGPASAAFALWAIRSPAGTEAFTAELGWYTGWSFPLITLPTLALTVWALRGAIEAIEVAAGVPLDDLLRQR